MSEKKIKIKNPNNWNVGIKLLSGVGINIKAGSIFYISKEDLEYIASMSKIFSKKHLIVEDKDFDMSIIGIEQDFLIDSDIIAKMKKNNAVLKKFLEEEVQDANMKRRVFNIAKELDLPVSKVRIIEEHTGFSFDME